MHRRDVTDAYFVIDRRGQVTGQYDNLVTAKQALDRSTTGKAAYRNRDGVMMCVRTASRDPEREELRRLFAQ